MQVREVARDRRRFEAYRAALANEPLELGPVILARRLLVQAATPSFRQAALIDGEFVGLYFPLGRSWADAGWADDVYVVANVVPPTSLDARDFIALLAPYRFLAGILPSGPTPERLPLSIGLRVLRRYLDGLLTLDRDRLCHRQTDLAANAIRWLLAAALLPAGVEQGLASRRRASLLDRTVTHIDANLLMPQTAETLCAALGCSRSALYRATAEAGGAEELIVKRRLIAIRNLLRHPEEQRAIAELAHLHCFSDTTQFNRRFKATFGVPPGEIRRRAIDPETAGRDRGDPLPCSSPQRSDRNLACS